MLGLDLERSCFIIGAENKKGLTLQQKEEITKILNKWELATLNKCKLKNDKKAIKK